MAQDKFLQLLFTKRSNIAIKKTITFVIGLS